MTDQDVTDIGSLIHRKWAEAFDALATVKKEKDDGSPDWQGFHEDRLTNTTANELHWSGVKSRFMSEYREVYVLTRRRNSPGS